MCLDPYRREHNREINPGGGLVDSGGPVGRRARGASESTIAKKLLPQFPAYVLNIRFCIFAMESSRRLDEAHTQPRSTELTLTSRARLLPLSGLSCKEVTSVKSTGLKMHV